MKKKKQPVYCKASHYSNKCQCVDAIHSKAHKKGCEHGILYAVVLNRVPSTHTDPLLMCYCCAAFAQSCCDGRVLGRVGVFS